MRPHHDIAIEQGTDLAFHFISVDPEPPPKLNVSQGLPYSFFPSEDATSERPLGELSYLRGLKVASSCLLACLGADLPAVKSCDDGMS